MGSRQPRPEWIGIWELCAYDFPGGLEGLKRHLKEVGKFQRDNVNQWIAGLAFPGPENLKELFSRSNAHGNPLLTEYQQEVLMEGWISAQGIDSKIHSVIARTFGPAGVAASQSGDSLTILSKRSEPRYIQVFMPAPHDDKSFLMEVASGIIHMASRYRYHATFTSIPDLYSKPSLNAVVDPRDLAGVIAIACRAGESTWLEECEQAGLPLVLIHDQLRQSQMRAYTKVSLLNEATRALANVVKHLIEKHERKHIHIITLPYNGHVHRQRKVDAIIAAAASKKISIRKSKQVHEVSKYSYGEGGNMALSILDDHTDVDAIVCLHDLIAAGAWDAVREAKRDVCVTGYDNSQIAIDFHLTSVDQHLQETGEDAVNEVLRLAGATSRRSSPNLRNTRYQPRTSCCPHLP